MPPPRSSPWHTPWPHLESGILVSLCILLMNEFSSFIHKCQIVLCLLNVILNVLYLLDKLLYMQVNCSAWFRTYDDLSFRSWVFMMFLPVCASFCRQKVAKTCQKQVKSLFAGKNGKNRFLPAKTHPCTSVSNVLIPGLS